MQREIEILMEVKHPNILKFYTCFEDVNSFYIVTEYAEKGNLSELQKRKKINQD